MPLINGLIHGWRIILKPSKPPPPLKNKIPFYQDQHLAIFNKELDEEWYEVVSLPLITSEPALSLPLYGSLISSLLTHQCRPLAAAIVCDSTLQFCRVIADLMQQLFLFVTFKFIIPLRATK